MLIVNPNSKNAEGAMKYLEFIRSHQSQASVIAFYPSINTPIKNSGYNDQVSFLLETISGIEKHMALAADAEKREMEQRIAQLKTEITDLADNEYLVSPQAIQTFREHAYLLHSVPVSILSKNNDEIQSLVKRYKDGQLPSKQLVDELNRKLRMAQLENR
jgi:cell division protein FtsB